MLINLKTHSHLFYVDSDPGSILGDVRIRILRLIRIQKKGMKTKNGGNYTVIDFAADYYYL